MLFFVLLVTLAVIGLLAFVGGRVAVVDGKQAAKIIESLDRKYESFIESRKSFLMAKQQSIENFVDEVMKIVKPEIEALVRHVTQSIYTGVKIPYVSTYFKNIVSLAESLYELKNHKNVREEYLRKFLQLCREAIESDLRRRYGLMEMGRIS